MDSIRNNRPQRSGAVADYLDKLASSFEGLRIPPEATEFDDAVVQSIDSFTPYRNECIELFMAIASHGPTADELTALHRFFERLFPFMYKPESVTTHREWDYDNFRFIVHELFLYLVASLLRYERIESAAELMRQPFYVGRLSESGHGTVSFAALRTYMRSLEHRNLRLNLRRLSLRSDMLTKRAETSGLSLDHLMQADFTLYIRDCLDSLRDNGEQLWWPETLLYVRQHHRPFELFARAQSKQYFEKIKQLFDIEGKTDFGPMLQAMQEQRLRIPRWDFESFGPAALLGYEQLATKP